MNPDLSPDQMLELLRDAQERELHKHRFSHDEWRQDVSKARGEFAHINPGVGMMGRGPGYTSSYAPTGPYKRSSGNQGTGLKQTPQQFGVPSGQDSQQGRSKYDTDRIDQPPPWIDDVDMSSIWYSPMEPVWPFGPPYYNRPRDWDFPVGYNLNYVPQRMQLYGTLQGMRQSWGVLATVIETRKDQLLRLPWTIQRKDKPRGDSATVNQVRKFFKRPDGQHSYSQWARLILDDLFVLDAPCIYTDRNMGGQIRTAEHIQGSTIFPLIDDAGRTPSTEVDITTSGIEYIRRQPAYQQIIYGLPMVNLSSDELIYAIMRPRADLPVFGYSPVEQVMVESTEAIRKTFYQLDFWRSGSMPELVVTVPDQWTPRQIAMFQAHFDALLSGNLQLKSKVRFLPGGMKPFDIKNASGESLWSQRDEMLIRLICYAFSVSPTPFVKQTNRGTAQNAAQSAQEEGLYPLMSWWKDDIMDRIIQDEMGFDDIEFVFLPRPEVDLLKQAQIHDYKLKSGEMTLDEARAENGEEPYASGIGAVPLIYFGSGAVPVEDVISGEAVLPGSPQQGNTGDLQRPENNGKNAPAKQSSPTKPLNAPQRGPATPQPSPKPTPVHKISRTEIDSASSVAVHKPTVLQTKNGNYKKGHFWLYGLNISIENAKGSTRGEKDANGWKWKVKMPTAYGYIRGTVGNDGDQVDVYIGKHPESEVVYVIDQDRFDAQGDDKGFDEHKVMLGYRSLKRVIKDYAKSHFDDLGEDRIAAITALSVKDFKAWLKSGDMNKPISEQNIGVVVLRRGDGSAVDKLLSKADTISQGTNLLSYDQLTAVPKRRRKKKLRRQKGPRWMELSA